MFDFSFGELAVIGAVALVVLGPERLPKVARTVGEWAGKAQRYVSQVKNDINREMEIADLKKLQEQAKEVAQTFEKSVSEGVSGLQNDLNSAAGSLNSGFDASSGATTGSSDAWDGTGDSWTAGRFQRRYKPGPSMYDLSEEIAKLKRQLAMPETHRASRQKYAPRARVNRPRIRR